MAAQLNVVSLVELNRSELEGVYNTYVTFEPGRAFDFTLGWWVGKVKEGGDWDYKVKEGYSPWYKEFTMIMYNGFREVHNSKWLGNYNYGYTGEFLFSLSTLLKGGDAISELINGVPDEPEVKGTIERGYAEAYYFY